MAVAKTWLTLEWQLGYRPGPRGLIPELETIKILQFLLLKINIGRKSRDRDMLY